MTAPPPLTPPDCDLSDFGFMPWQPNRFRKSALVANAEPEEILAAMLLYGEAWHNVPAASLENNDRALASAAGYGRAVGEWLKVKAGALRGWIECSDGRLYHPIVAEHARAAWQRKLEQRHRTFCAAVRKHNERNPHDRRQPPTFDHWEATGRPDRVTTATAQPVAKQGDLELGTDDAPVRVPARAPARDCASAPAHTGATTVPPEKPQKPVKSHARQGAKSRVTRPKVTGDMASKGQGQGQGQGDSKERLIESPLPPSPETLAAELAELGGVRLPDARAQGNAVAEVSAWLEAGIDPDTMRKAVRAFTANARTPSRSLHRFDSDVRLLHAKAAPTPSKAEKAASGTDDDDPRIREMRLALRQRLGARTYDGWLKNSALTLNGTGVIVTCPSAFMRDWTADHLATELANAAAAHGLGTVKVTVAQGART